MTKRKNIMRTQTRLQFPAILIAVFLMLLVTNCTDDKDENKPVVTTYEVTAIKSTEALCGGTISSDGGFAVTTRGVCWSTDPNPTIDDNKTTDGAGAGSFTSQISGLQPKTNYYIRAYATNSNGTGYGMAMAFETIGAAVLTTAEVTEISYTTAVCGGTIVSDGDQTITARGVCWSTSPDSVELENALGLTVNGSGIGGFESELLGLSPGATYFVRAYANNSIETNYGEIESFKTLYSILGDFTDARDGNVYQTVKIGDQTWMAENLAYLPSVVGPGTGSYTTPYYYVSDYNGAYVAEAEATENFQTYGVLYNWPAAMAGSTSSDANPSGLQGVCPTGWHLPSSAEWAQLIDYMGGAYVEVGGKLKETGTKHWKYSDIGATNETGFTAIPGGCRYYDNERIKGIFSDTGYYCYFWTSTDINTGNARYYGINTHGSSIFLRSNTKESAHSIRCLKD
jgi:uncharacterized protein (TIGR02145 family)